MHDHLRDLGRYLAENEPSECELRLWRPIDNFIYNCGQQRGRGISLVHRNIPEQVLEKLVGSCNLFGLQLLRAEGDFVQRLLSAGQFPRLIYLRWENCPIFSLPSSFPIQNLRVLHIEGNYLKTLWQDECQPPLQLKEMYISAPLSKVPTSIGELKHLEKLGLSSSCLGTLPDEFCHMHSLKHVDLKWCTKLISLPDSLGSLTSLLSFDLGGCSSMHSLPESVGSLRNLERLDFGGCSSMQALPDSVGSLESLKNLDLGGCSSLQGLPEIVGSLTSLQSLDLSRCSTLRTLPDSVGSLTNLERLDLGWCSQN